tara:strand:+ start:438 stop:815 length:378 start_codon:yes stop_codon:yes gene_type:complete
MIARILSGTVGTLMLMNCLWWILDPATAAKGLAMPLLVGLESNSQIGDFTAFFFTAGLFAFIGAYRAEHIWLYPTISLIGSAAFFRLYAVLAHDSEPLVETIIFEIVISAILILCVFLMKKEKVN